MISPRAPLPFILGKKKPKMPRWRSEERFVTAIIGMHGYPGVVLCADSEETVSGYSKKMVDKIEQWEHEPFRFSIGSAGAGHYADMVAREVSKSLFGVLAYSLPDIQKAIEGPLLEFHQTHIWPRASKDSALDAGVQLIIVVQPLPGGAPEIFHSSETAVQRLEKHSYVSIGVGSHLADYILETMYSPSGGEEHLLTMAVLVMREVIGNIAYVGKQSNVYFFGNDGSVRWLYDDELKEIEAGLEEWDGLLKYVLHFLTDVGPHARHIWGHERISAMLREVHTKFDTITNNRLTREQKYQEWVDKKVSEK